MANPFPIGGPVTGTAFWNRQVEIREVTSEIQNGQNVIISSPRRYGKTSLIKTVLERAGKKNVFCVYVDLYPASTKEKFIKVFAKSVAGAVGKPQQKILDYIKELFPRLMPKILVHGDGIAEFTFSLSPKDKEEIDLPDLLNAVHQHAERKKQQACVVFDEFQEIAKYVDDEVEREMRTVFQNHKNVCYIFMGSRKHLINNLFHNPNRPFYKSGIHLPLKKLPLKEVKKYIQPIFEQGKIKVTEPALEMIAGTGNGHPYYTQLICHILWEEQYPKGTIQERDVDDALRKSLLREQSVYQAILESLTENQKSLLIALGEDPGAQVFSQDFMVRHDLGPVSSLRRALQALVKKDLVDRINGTIEFQDPFFSLWLKENH